MGATCARAHQIYLIKKYICAHCAHWIIRPRWLIKSGAERQKSLSLRSQARYRTGRLQCKSEYWIAYSATQFTFAEVSEPYRCTRQLASIGLLFSARERSWIFGRKWSARSITTCNCASCNDYDNARDRLLLNVALTDSATCISWATWSTPAHTLLFDYSRLLFSIWI